MATEEEREELIRKLEALRPEMAKIMLQFGAHEPNWMPLERLLMWDFMFMGYDEGKRMYKHQFTRRYLHIDAAGRTYRWTEQRGFERIPAEEAIAHVFEDLEALIGHYRQDSEEEWEG